MIPCAMEHHEEQDPRIAMIPVVQAFLATNPNWWMTLTWERPETRASVAADSLRSWLSQWRKAGLSAGTSRRGRFSPISRLIWCAETQQRGTAHIHALGCDGNDVTTPHCPRCFSAMGFRSDCWKWWALKESWKVHYGIARIYPFDPCQMGGVVGYCTKYMFKSSGESPEWGLWEEGVDF